MKTLNFVALMAVAMSSQACLVRTAYPVTDGALEVSEGPPAAQVEVIGVAPSPNHIWVNGHWVASRHGWRWQSGYWTVRRAGAVWVHPAWVRRGNRHVYVEGYWR